MPPTPTPTSHLWPQGAGPLLVYCVPYGPSLGAARGAGLACLAASQLPPLPRALNILKAAADPRGLLGVDSGSAAYTGLALQPNLTLDQPGLDPGLGEKGTGAGRATSRGHTLDGCLQPGALNEILSWLGLLGRGCE